jgi:hypothetical protein
MSDSFVRRHEIFVSCHAADMLDRHKLTIPDRDLADYWNLEGAKSTSSDLKHVSLVAIRMHDILETTTGS